ncbi:MAG: TIR domain-containing protein [Candidatus Aminicenantes bacterium]|nr:TIR domain-containing protein [Candidatus Aminicenantes bacterium]NIM82840.1 TIR domain-containing protein [Candidatus Aminicenantes bacterium]NIN22216.1 TIR domain-containing protein [Candidatus Aminicenantes bacterium]NIN45984.1 TIR domain-containing protein [Candidatus Aminicenantes bacterium]NIN88820.1 TIR domain-containing protein [Candidatus Aminicenantes bacterium]
MGKVFISYNKADRKWAEWIGWQLEEAGYSIILQVWDFKPGSNFVLEMQKAIKEAERTIAVLSPDYLDASFTHPEWAAAFAQDPTGEKGILVPVLVRQCDPDGLLSQINYINLVGLDNDTAKNTLINGLSQKRLKPDKPPVFPGKPIPSVERSIHEKPSFPPDDILLYKLPVTGPKLFGREKELKILYEAWKEKKIHVITLVAWGGVGKTALVNYWLNLMEQDNFRGAEKVYGWSFYSQGAAEGKQASADEFMQDTLKWFGDKNPKEGSAVDKGRRLARLIRKQRTLLILDGLEPLQYPPGEAYGMEGQVKDPGLKTMLKELAASQPGLCVITTRESVTDLKNKIDFTVKEICLEHLSDKAGVELLKNFGIKGLEKEILEAVQDFDGHALALNLLGQYLKSVHQSDIRKRDKIPKLTKEKKQGGHARRVMEAYEKWLGKSAELDILRIMGLFDRPVEIGAINALKAKRPIPGVTKKLKKISIEDWQYALNNLRDANLLAKENPKKPDVLDCHPLIREHFGEKLQNENPKGWKEAHKRLYHYYKELPEKELPDTLQEMEPLFAAIAHGCQAGLHREALYDVYYSRTQRDSNTKYCCSNLGAFGSDLASVSHFFEKPWSQPAAGLNDYEKGAALNWASFSLRALGRLNEALRPMKVSMEVAIQQKEWLSSAKAAGNLSELALTLGQVEKAVEYARQCVTYSDRSDDEFRQMATRTILADALHHSGQLEDAEKLLIEAEEMQKKRQPEYSYLYSLWGFRFCDLLLAQGKYQEVIERSGQTLKWAKHVKWLLDIALDQLSLGRAWMIKAQKEKKEYFTQANDYLDQAVAGLRKAGYQYYLVIGLLDRAAFYRLQKDFSKARDDLNEALEIAELGSMKLYLADYHLEAGKLYEAEGNAEEALHHFQTAKEMMEKMGYKRKLKEVNLCLSGAAKAREETRRKKYR